MQMQAKKIFHRAVDTAEYRPLNDSCPLIPLRVWYLMFFLLLYRVCCRVVPEERSAYSSDSATWVASRGSILLEDPELIQPNTTKSHRFHVDKAPCIALPIAEMANDVLFSFMDRGTHKAKPWPRHCLSVREYHSRYMDVQAMLILCVSWLNLLNW